MNREVSLLPHHTNHDSPIVLLDLDRGTTRKCGRAGSADWDRHDRLPERVRAAHRVMPEHASGHERSARPKLRVTIETAKSLCVLVDLMRLRLPRGVCISWGYPHVP